ncbi:PE family protein, partial [Mycobacterium kansasii]
MSYLVAGPEYLSAAANSLAGIGSTLGEANAAAAASTTRIFAPALDEVSKAATALFSQHAQAYQAFSAHAARFHEQFVRTLATSAGLYHSTETFNALGAAAATNPLTAMNSAAQNLLAPVNAVSAAANAQSLALTGRPLVGNGANGGPGQPGKPGGWLGGNGGRGGDGLPGQPGGRG